VCFLDYQDFFTFNFPSIDPELPSSVPRPAIQTEEATRLILMKIHVTNIEPPGPNDGQDLPVVHFRGFSRALDGAWDENANSDLKGEVNFRGLFHPVFSASILPERTRSHPRDPVSLMRGSLGTCRLTREGEVRWTTFSIFQGQERWRSEGVQVGGVRSARGVLGNWFDKDYDPHGPCGPTAFWKISDRDSKDEDGHVLYSDFLPLLDGAEAAGDAEDGEDGEYAPVDGEDDDDEDGEGGTRTLELDPAELEALGEALGEALDVFTYPTGDHENHED
jgi:hypothetical protein